MSLIAELPDGTVVTDPDIVASYRQDRAADPNAGTAAGRGAAPPHRGGAGGAALGHRRTRSPWCPAAWAPDCPAARPRSTARIVLTTEKMRDITVDPVTRTAVAQPGLLNAEVKKAVAEYGLWYPPDPSSFEICSIGGNIATNAGGLCCVKYGVTTDYVLGLQVVLADGTAVRLGGPRLKDVAGLSADEAVRRQRGHPRGDHRGDVASCCPPSTAACTVVASFDSVAAAADAVVTITGKIRPSMLEFMDSRGDQRRRGQTEDGAGPQRRRDDGRRHRRPWPGRRRGRRVHGPGVHRSTVRQRCSRPIDPEEGEAFVAARRYAIPAVEAKGSLLLEDVGVPLPALADLVAASRRSPQQHDLMISVIAHAGDGNTHPLIVFDPADAAMAERANTAFGEIMDLAVGLGRHDHRRARRGPAQAAVAGGLSGPEAMELNRRIKAALDPDNILNPGAAI